MSTQTVFRIPEQTLKSVQQLRKSTGISASEHLRRAWNLYLAANSLEKHEKLAVADSDTGAVLRFLVMEP
jgi:hypothetical protein